MISKANESFVQALQPDFGSELSIKLKWYSMLYLKKLILVSLLFIFPAIVGLGYLLFYTKVFLNLH